MFDLAGLITNLRRAAAGAAPEKDIRRMIAAAVAEPETVAAGLAGGARDRAEETLLHADDRLTLYDVRLAPGVLYPAHDHRMPAVIGLYRGREINLFYRETASGTLETAGRRDAEAGEVLPLGRNVIHAVANPDRVPSGALHAYLGDLTRIERRLWPRLDDRAAAFTEAAYLAAARPLAGTEI